MAVEDPKSKTPPEEVPSAFTLDTEEPGAADMPSVTRLLNRRSLDLGIPAAAKPPGKPPGKPPSLPPGAPAFTPPPAASAPPPRDLFATPSSPTEAPPPAAAGGGQKEISLSLDAGSFQLETSSGPASGSSEAASTEASSEVAVAPAGLQASLEISAGEISLGGAPGVAAAEPPAPESAAEPEPRAAIRARLSRRAKQSLKDLIVWDLAQLRAGADPLGKGLAQLFQKGGAHAALFLGIQPPPPGSPAPVFDAAAVVTPGKKTDVWRGLRWDPTVVPDLWNIFVKLGQVELSPPGTRTYVKSNRNVVRGAFGIQQDEWITLVRAGPVNGCRGIIAIVSRGSVLSLLEKARPLLGAAPPQAA